MKPGASALLMCVAISACCSTAVASPALEVSISPELSMSGSNGVALTVTITNKTSKPVEFYFTNNILTAISADHWVVRPPSLIVTGSVGGGPSKLAPGESINAQMDLIGYFDKVVPGPDVVKFHVSIPLEHHHRPVEMDASVRFVLSPAMARVTNRAINHLHGKPN